MSGEELGTFEDLFPEMVGQAVISRKHHHVKLSCAKGSCTRKWTGPQAGQGLPPLGHASFCFSFFLDTAYDSVLLGLVLVTRQTFSTSYTAVQLTCLYMLCIR